MTVLMVLAVLVLVLAVAVVGQGTGWLRVMETSLTPYLSLVLACPA